MDCKTLKGKKNTELTSVSFFCPLSPHSILGEAKNLSFNATAAFKAYSNIKANVDAAEKEAKAAKQRASEALALVSGHVYKSTCTHLLTKFKIAISLSYLEQLFPSGFKELAHYFYHV